MFYSALTTATAFGSLWLSSHPGTSSMGKLLALSLSTTLAAAVLFQPVLMGKPREAVPESELEKNEFEKDEVADTPGPMAAPIRNVTAAKRRNAS